MSALHDTVAARLEETDNRYTRSRRELIEVLRDARQPLTIAEILAAASHLPQSSVYRNLTMFEETGLVHRLLGAGELARFELAEDLLGHHHHMVCTGCGSMTDIELSARLEETIESALAVLARRRGFRLHAHRVDVLGLCRDCAATR